MDESILNCLRITLSLHNIYTREMRHTFNKNINEYAHYEVHEDDTLLNYLLNNLTESRSKIKATLQGRGIKVNGKVVTQFDFPLT